MVAGKKNVWSKKRSLNCSSKKPIVSVHLFCYPAVKSVSAVGSGQDAGERDTKTVQKNEKIEGTHFQKTAQCDWRITMSVYVMERVGVLDALYTHSVYWCHDFYQRWFLSLFGRCSAVGVAGLLAVTDPFLFCWFVLSLVHSHLVFICFNFCVYIYPCFPLRFVRDYFHVAR